MSHIADLSRSLDYYAARAEEERRLAKSTTDVNARAIHMEMAERYVALARGIDEPSNSHERVTAR